LFPDSTINTLHKLSGGVPRLINIIGDRALLGAYTQDKTRVSKSILKKAAHEVFGETEDKSLRKAVAWVPIIIILAVFGAVLAKSYYNSNISYKENLINDPVEQIIGSDPTLTREASGSANAYWPDTISHATSKGTAYTAIFEKWNIVYNPKENGYACNYARTKGLNCLSKRGNLRSLLLLNRPAVLHLIDEKGKDYYAAMTAFDGQIATLTIGTETISTDVNHIESRWLGFYLILWRPPPEYNSSIHITDEGPSVQWLDKQLSIINERAFDGEGTSIFSDNLEAEVKRFQAAEGLMPDGVVGAQTFIRLNDHIDDSVPNLTTAKEEQ
jgi:general secretion pathway protein A